MKEIDKDLIKTAPETVEAEAAPEVKEKPKAGKTGAKKAETVDKKSGTGEKKAENKGKKAEDMGKKADKADELNDNAEPEKESESPALAKLLAEADDKYLRLYAEYDNFRRRSKQEKEALYAEIKADTVTKFLPVYDNLKRALEQSTEDEAYKKGVELIMAQFMSTLEKLGVKKIDALGQNFDPNFHNAVMHEDNEALGENEISLVFQEGFTLGEKVIRFSMVKVAN